MILSNLWNSVLFSYAVTSFASLQKAEAAKNEPDQKASYVPAQSIPVSCLNRTAYVYFSFSLFKPPAPNEFAAKVISWCTLQKAVANSKFLGRASDSDTGEHITDSKGELQYIPFPTCNETGRPLEFYFGVEKGWTLYFPRRSFATHTY